MMYNVDHIIKILDEVKYEYDLLNNLKDVEKELNQIINNIQISSKEQARQIMLQLTLLNTKVDDISNKSYTIDNNDVNWRCNNIRFRIMKQISELRSKYSL